MLKDEYMREIRVCSRSKKWWKSEWKPLRKAAKKNHRARKELGAKIREAKREQWKDFVEKGEDVWKIGRVTRNPWNFKERCRALETEDREVVGKADHDEKCRAFLQHNIIEGNPPTLTDRTRTKTRCPEQGKDGDGEEGAGQNQASASTGPDGVTWRLLKMLKNTRLGTAVLEDVAQATIVENRYYGEEEWREMTMVMIQKPGWDKTMVKGWRPMVLINVIGKLADKVIGERLMRQEKQFHEGRKGRGAIDSVVFMDQIRKETGGDIYRRDIRSAFNTLNREVMREVLRGHEDLRDWVDYFLRPRTFAVKVDGRVIGEGTMAGGTPQGPPLSPTLFMIYMLAMVWEVECLHRRKEDARKHTKHTRSKGQAVVARCEKESW